MDFRTWRLAPGGSARLAEGLLWMDGRGITVAVDLNCARRGLPRSLPPIVRFTDVCHTCATRLAEIQAGRQFDLRLDALRDPGRPVPKEGETLRQAALALGASARALACAGEPGFCPDARAGLADIRSSVSSLVGLGAGLTPSGDDLLCGFISAVRARFCGEPHAGDELLEALCLSVEESLGSTGEISASLVRFMIQGHWPEPLLELADAIAAGREYDALQALEDLCRLGHSSGADIATGFLFGLEALPDRGFGTSAGSLTNLNAPTVHRRSRCLRQAPQDRGSESPGPPNQTGVGPPLRKEQQMRNKAFAALGFATITFFAALTASAADWSDTFIGFRTGSDYKETGISDSVGKNIITFSHVSGYSLGQNFFIVDLLMSDRTDPANTASPGTSKGAYDADLVYRHDLDLGKVFKTNFGFGPVRGVSLTAGLEYETKNTMFAPATFKVIVGPTLNFRVPGYLKLGVCYYQERNHNAFGGYSANYGGGINVKYDPTYFVYTAWGIPLALGPVNTLFEGFGNYTGAKGKDGSAIESKPETLIRAYWMFDVGSLLGGKRNVWMVGPGWEYWHNKFGIPTYEAGESRPPYTQVNPKTSTFVAALEAHF
jgi:hypothetical protein